MTRYDLMDFDPFKNYTIGFDRIFDSLLEVSKLNTSNFPPYNIRKVKDGKYEIELALAGFTKGDIKVELKDGVLSISAKREDKDSNNLIHQGIASRSVLRKFSLSEYMEIVDAYFADGMLNIKCIENIPEEKKPKIIKVN
jgi:molecular chaperone IbpA